ncbi:RES family NAD+ phosphorylase [Paralcaligenes sp. KSB-10]|uniref:RES family NAD+ phosphorylase n=1 Tax=Paralcaligenes sp. KSB-10 TaxID=2901142 RepID=UPI001E462CB5|nr:RES family NAD+ phosphorylase [Paralcaligenes sp. KSB-10]UHL63259.1 RES family NAD+ phosphorylase [Paralcaligenes sp. KSB-10]
MTAHIKVWRIATDAPDFTADDKSGMGAKITGGHWSREGTPMVYCASSIALACLETIVHLNFDGLPLNRFLVEVSIPEKLWSAAQTLKPENHVGWDTIPAGKVGLDTGDDWVVSNTSLLLIVPSVIVPEEHNALLNPRHPDIAKITFKKIRQWHYDARLPHPTS